MTLVRTTGPLVLLALAVVTSPSIAQETGTLGWYGGASIGQSKATIDNERISNSLLGSGFASSTITNDRRDLAFKVLGGYQMNRYLAVEGGYFDLGKFGYSATTTPAGTLTGEARVRGLNLDLLGRLPVTDKFSVFGRAGVTYAQTRDSFRGTGLVVVNNPNPSERDTNLKFGVGMEYAFTPSLSARAEIERYRINDAVGNRGDIDMASLGLVYRFGAKSPSPVPRAMQEPVVIAAAPAPAPAPVAPIAAAPQPVLKKKVTFSADSLFDFDQATVKSAGKQDLDKFAADIKGTDYETIEVAGHTDRLGRVAYNQKLSTRRAEAVKTYLINSAGIPAAKINAIGKEASQPVTKAGECRGGKATKKLITCLQPDRRVEVEVSGLK